MVDFVSLLAGTESIFSGLSEADLHSIEQELEWVVARGGDVLMSQGDEGDSMYLLVSGRLRASRRTEDGAEQTLGEVGHGESVGEMALITGGVRLATVRAIRDSNLIRFSKDAFDRIMNGNPRAALVLAKRIVLRVTQQNARKAKPSISTVGVIAAADGVDIADFCERLTKALSEIGSTFLLNRQVLETHIGPGAATATDRAMQSRIDAWFDQLERHNSYVVYQGDDEPSPWTDRCARQADRLLFLAKSTSSPHERNIPDTWKQVIARHDLVLLHPKKDRVTLQVAAWRQKLGIANHHHVVADSIPDYQRLARILTGRAVGLTLGGGGARGLAHIGVIKAMQEAGIPIDMICGTSMGAVLSGQYAMGYDLQAMMEVNRKGWIAMDPMKDKTLPLVAMLAGKKLDAMLEMMFGDTQIEDLWTTYFCVSANLTQAKAVIHQSGPLKNAVRASMAIPGVAAPVVVAGDLLVDGGVLNNLPGDLMRNVCGGTVIAVDVSPKVDLAVDMSYTELPSAWEILRSRMPGSTPLKIPNIFALMMRTLMLSSADKSNSVMREVDLYIRPAVDAFAIFEWASMEKIVDAGYQTARKQLEEWQAGREPAPIAAAAR
jgi:NTE family protein/lysophospholipid hydrolase